MTTAARKRRESGQSMLEFALLLPVLLAMIGAVVGVGTVIQMAIVNQKYTRAQLHFLQFNHRGYLERRFQRLGAGEGYKGRFWIGMDKNNIYGQTANVRPVPMSYRVGVGPAPATDRVPRDPSARQNVRVRITTFTCLPPIGVQFGNPFSEENLDERSFVRPRPGFCIN